MYARDISKKVRAARKVAASQGKFMGSVPAYGYRKSETDKHKLVIDDEAAAVVRRIFALTMNHHSRRSIAEMLNSEGILTPQNYYYHSQGRENPYKRNKKTWCSNTISTILKNEVYLGHVTMFQLIAVQMAMLRAITPDGLRNVMRSCAPNSQG